MIRYIKARPRLTAAMLIVVSLACLLPGIWRLSTRLLIAWDSGIFYYLITIGVMMARSTVATIQCRAAEQDEGKIGVLLLTIVTALASLVAIVVELATAKTYTGSMRADHIALAGLTVFLSWSFMQLIFALHYAHEYYLGDHGNSAKGLDFPGQTAPDYWDFIYFSFIIGTAAQTADVNITSQTLRRINILHCVVVFFFNTTILALTVNIGASLL